MKKSISKRLRLTKTGKVLRRRMAQDHFRAKKSGKQIQRKREVLRLHNTDIKVFKKYF